MRAVISETQRTEALKLLKEWEKQGCTYKDVEERISVLHSVFTACKSKMWSELECRLENEPFAKFSGAKEQD